MIVGAPCRSWPPVCSSLPVVWSADGSLVVVMMIGIPMGSIPVIIVNTWPVAIIRAPVITTSDTDRNR